MPRWTFSACWRGVTSAASLMIVASYRPADASRRAHPVTLIHRELQTRGVSSEIALKPFSLDEVKDYLIRRFPDIKIPDSVSRALFTRTAGLPLFVSNLIEYLVSQHQGWPLSLKTSWIKRYRTPFAV